MNSNFVTSETFQKSVSHVKASNSLTWISQFQGQTHSQTTFVGDEWSPRWIYWLSDWCLRYIHPISPRWHIRSCVCFSLRCWSKSCFEAKTIQRGECFPSRGRVELRAFEVSRFHCFRMSRRFLPRWRWGHVGARKLLVGTSEAARAALRWWPPVIGGQKSSPLFGKVGPPRLAWAHGEL